MADKPIDEMSDKELQRVIAELRGYRIHTLSEHDLDQWEVVFPDGHVQLVTEPDEPFSIIPNWTQDTHAAVVDMLAEMPGWVLYYSGGFPVFWVVKGNAEDYEIPEDCPTINHTDPARAISMAWLIWKRGNDGR